MRENGNATNNATVIRVHKNKNYTVMSNKHLFQKDLSLKAKGLMSVFLALPDDWNYSISGLCKIVKEGKDSLNATISELKKFGYIDIERINAERGRFSFVYHIYEEGKNISPCTGFPCTGFPCTVDAYTENPNAVVPTAVSPNSVNPQQLNTNIQNTKEQNTNNQLSLVKTEESVFTFKDLVDLYKTICVHFPQPRKMTDSRKQKGDRRLKENPSKEFWKTVFEKAERSLFIRKKSSFFCFDWVLENDRNAMKVYEGNYNKEEIKEENQSTGNQNGKYSKCYG